MSAPAPRPQLVSPELEPEKYQREASDPKTSVWVGASAGSGKTTVLTSRVMRLLLDDVKPQKILCLTFTRAAAAEMANRITEKLSRWATCSDDELRDDLDYLQGAAPTTKQLKDARRLFARVLSCPGGMRIRTIHAFCQEILGRFPVEAGLPPHFAVIEESDAEELADDAQREFLQEIADTQKHPLAKTLEFLVRDLGERGFGSAIKSLRSDRVKLNAALAHAGSLDALIAEMRDLLGLGPQDREQSIITEAIDFAVLPQTELRQAAQCLLNGTKTYQARGKTLLAWLNLPPEKRTAAFNDYCGCFFTTKNTIYETFGDSKLLKAHPELDTILGQEATRLQSIKERIETATIAETTEAVLRIGHELIGRYEKRKAAQAALDYDDLIIRTNDLLHRPGIAPWVLYKLDGGLDHILVDEAQDTNRAQWNIIKVLADEFFGGISARDNTERSLFAVGDEKQSIFSFQKAEPEAFAQMRDYFAERLRENGKQLHPVGLHVSFRSAPAILKAVDAVFSKQSVQSGVSMEAIHHFPSRPRAGESEKVGRVELWPLYSASEKAKAEEGLWGMPIGYEEEHDPQALLANSIAKKIKTWIDSKEILPGKNRPITSSDIMILLRNRGRFADLMVRALKKTDVPVTGVDRMKLTRQLPVMDLLALMQFALLPEDDLNLAAVLRGPLLNASEDELMELAIGRKTSLWQSLLNKSKTQKSFAGYKDYLVRLLNEADFITPFSFLARILNETCPGSYTSGRHALWSRLGPDALDPVEELLNAAQDFGARHAPSLQTFLHWVTQSDKTIKRELDQGGDEVRIMTIHGAKGLEAPIVFLPDMTGVPRVQDIPKLQWSSDNLPLYLSRRPASGVARTLWSEARRKQMEEYRRLLYVALTRAANRLYIGGWEPAKKEAGSEERWYNLVEEGLKLLEKDPALIQDQSTASIAFADPETQTPPPAPAIQKAVAKVLLPDWASRPATAEPELARNLAPSQSGVPAATTPDILFTRGRIIHRLLQSLPDIDDTKRDAVTARFLANPQHSLTAQQQKEIGDEILHLLRHPVYAPLFGTGSRAEVPMTGTVNGELVARQVDRLCIKR